MLVVRFDKILAKSRIFAWGRAQSQVMILFIPEVFQFGKNGLHFADAQL